MKIKGTGLKTTQDFVKTEFENGFQNWLNSLPEESKKHYQSTINISAWYPLKEGFLDPLDKIIELFYNNDVKSGAEAVGRYSAEIALKGVYKVFLLVATTAFLIKRASKIIATYYDPSEVEAYDTSKKSATIRIIRFPEINLPLEIRIAAWCQKALKLTGCSDVQYDIKKSLVKNDQYTEIVFNWN